jgi:hypothetical protein
MPRTERTKQRYCCARCGALKEYTPGLAYCSSCSAKISHEWRLAHGWIPKPNYGRRLCKCGQPRYVHPRTKRADRSYCQSCKRASNLQYRLAHPK